MPAEQYTYLSSRLIKEVFGLGGEVHGLVPSVVEARLRAKSAATMTKTGDARAKVGKM
jgi:pantetheine-phosphate adenylyltransferase